MKNNILYTLLFVLIASIAFTQETEVSTTEVEEESLWHTSAAKTIKAGRTENGIFAPLRIGLKNNMEIQVHPLWFFVMPNARIKKNWSLDSNSKFQVATEHGFTFPTPLLNLLAKEGVGGILPPTKKVPAILTLKNKVILSYYYDKMHSVSLKGAMEFNVLSSMNNGMQEIELLLVYPRTAAYNNAFVGEVAMNFSGIFAKKIGYDADVRMFLIPTDNLTWVFEWNPKLYFNASNKLRIMAGAVITTGNIQHEKANYRAMPVLDLQFSFGKKCNGKKKK